MGGQFRALPRLPTCRMSLYSPRTCTRHEVGIYSPRDGPVRPLFVRLPNDGEDIAFSHQDDFFVIQLDFVAGVGAEDHLVASLNGQWMLLAVSRGDALAHSDNFTPL